MIHAVTVLQSVRTLLWLQVEQDAAGQWAEVGTGEPSNGMVRILLRALTMTTIRRRQSASKCCFYCRFFNGVN